MQHETHCILKTLNAFVHEFNQIEFPQLYRINKIAAAPIICIATAAFGSLFSTSQRHLFFSYLIIYDLLDIF